MKFPRSILDQHIAVLGKTRSGKSSVLRLIVEQLLDDGQRVCIIDPKGDWWGLKSSADGKKAGYPLVIFGGQRADVPINAHAGASVAELVATGNRPCLIDLGGWSVADRTKLFIEFAEGLFRNIVPTLHLVIDECHNFAPQQGVKAGGSVPLMLHWANRIASEGAGKGILVYSASQRPQKVHKDFLTCAETLIAMRVIHPLDRNAIKEWMDGAGDASRTKDILSTLAEQARGEGWIWSPEAGIGPERRKFPKFKTYDSFAPQAARSAASLKGWADVDLKEVTAKLQSVVEEAKANDPKELKRQIADLKAQALKQQKISPELTPIEIERAVNKAIAERDREWSEKMKAMVRTQKTLVEKMSKAGLQAEQMALTLNASGAIESVEPPAVIHPEREPRGISTRRPDAVSQAAERIADAYPAGQKPTAKEKQQWANEVRKRVVPSSEANGTLPIGWRKILMACAERESAVARRELTIVTGYKRSSRDAYISRLSAKGYLSQSGTGVTITPEGLAALGDYEPLPTGEALRQHWLNKLPMGERAILAVICEAYPQAASKDAISESTGYKRSSRDAYISRLAARELVESDDPGSVKASDKLFD